MNALRAFSYLNPLQLNFRRYTATRFLLCLNGIGTNRGLSRLTLGQFAQTRTA
jgi:hypothetical protein